LYSPAERPLGTAYVELVAPTIGELFRYHWYVAGPEQLLTLEVKIGAVEYPVHSCVAPLGVIVTLGDWLTITWIAFDPTVHPPHVTSTLNVCVPAPNPVGTRYVLAVAPLIGVPL